MPFWTPETKWKDQDVFIIGGGVSLEKFDWELLRPDDIFTIGCNDAYLRGPDICNICLFGDLKWWREHQRGLESFRESGKGAVFTSCPQLYKKEKTSWLWLMNRNGRGLQRDALGWNKNTGAGAVNLALLLGAKRVFLLGFDMHLTGGRSNWHDNNLDKPNEAVYPRFLKGFERMQKDMGKFLGSEIFNITDDSSLDIFPKIGVNEFWSNYTGRKNIAAKIGV